VVVVTGAGTVVCCDVVVVLDVGVDVQAQRDMRAAATANGRMSLFMGLTVFRMVALRVIMTSPVAPGLWGVSPSLLLPKWEDPEGWTERVTNLG
jgi:hypothetical protein